MKIRFMGEAVLVLGVALLALAGCDRRSDQSRPEGPLGEVKPPPKSAEAAKREWASEPQPAEEVGPPRTVEEAERLLEAIERWEEARREETREPKVVTLEGLTEILRIENVGTVACGDLLGDGSFRIIAEMLSGEGRGVQTEIVIYDIKGTVLARWGVGNPVSQICLVQADDDAAKEILTSYLGSQRGIRRGTAQVALYEADGTLRWEDTAYREPLVEGTWDLDGDGKDEFLIRDLRQSLKLLDSDGSVCWERADLAMIGTVYAGDVDGDGVQELIGEYRQLPGRPDIVILTREGKTMQSLSREDIDGLNALQGVADVAPDSPGPEILVSTGAMFQSSLLVLAANGRILRPVPLDNFRMVVAAAEIVPTSRGPELVVQTWTLATEELGVKVLAGNGSLLFDVPLRGKHALHGEGVLWGAADGLLAVMRVLVEPQLVVCDAHGNMVARARGFADPHLVSTAPSSAGPVFAVTDYRRSDETSRLTVYTVQKE